MGQAKKSGFNGGLVIDFPESTKAKKYYLVLVVGGMINPILPKSLSTTSVGDTISYSERNSGQGTSHNKRQNNHRRDIKGTKEWVHDKKERRRRQGKETRADTKYTGRKRSGRF